MRIIRKRRLRIGSFVLEASIATPIVVVLLAAMLSSMTAINSELYVHRATENVVQEINLAIPIASQGFSCIDDIAKFFGVGDLLDVDTKDIDTFLGAFGAVSGATDVDFEDIVGTVAFGRLVRDRIVNEYRKICKNNWVATDLLKTMSVYLDYDKEKKCSRAKRVLIGKLDPDSGQIIPTDGRNKGARSKPKQLSPEIDMQKRIQELEDENRQLILQINALKKELARINSKSSQR